MINIPNIVLNEENSWNIFKLMNKIQIFGFVSICHILKHYNYNCFGAKLIVTTPKENTNINPTAFLNRNPITT